MKCYINKIENFLAEIHTQNLKKRKLTLSFQVSHEIINYKNNTYFTNGNDTFPIKHLLIIYLMIWFRFE